MDDQVSLTPAIKGQPTLSFDDHDERTLSVVRWAVRDSIVLIGRSIRHSARSVDVLVTSIVLPVLLLLMFVYVLGARSTPPAAVTSSTSCRGSSCWAPGLAPPPPRSASART